MRPLFLAAGLLVVITSAAAAQSQPPAPSPVRVVGTVDKLDEYIARCDAVIHLIGNTIGALAPADTLRSLRRRCPDIAFICVGAAMDFISAEAPRAPTGET